MSSGHRGKGAGRYVRHQPQRGFCIREYYHRLCKCCVVRLNAESSSRPRTPSPLFEGGGEAKITFDCILSETRYVYRWEWRHGCGDLNV